MCSLFEEANDTEKEVANILLELRTLFIISNAAAVPAWGFKGRRSGRKTTAPPRQRRSSAAHGVASGLETSSSCKSGGGESESDDEKTDNPSEIKAEPSGIEPSSISKGKVKGIKFNPPRLENSPQVGDGDQSNSKQIINDEPPSPKEDVYPVVMVTKSKKKTSDKRAKEEFEEGIAEVAVLAAQPEGHLVGGSRKIKAEATTMLESNPLLPYKKTAKRKSLQEMENEVEFWEQNKRAFLESMEKVKDYLEKQKALNLLLKARKLQLSSIKARCDSGS